MDSHSSQLNPFHVPWASDLGYRIRDVPDKLVLMWPCQLFPSLYNSIDWMEVKINSESNTKHSSVSLGNDPRVNKYVFFYYTMCNYKKPKSKYKYQRQHRSISSSTSLDRLILSSTYLNINIGRWSSVVPCTSQVIYVKNF